METKIAINTKLGSQASVPSVSPIARNNDRFIDVTPTRESYTGLFLAWFWDSKLSGSTFIEKNSQNRNLRQSPVNRAVGLTMTQARIYIYILLSLTFIFNFLIDYFGYHQPRQQIVAPQHHQQQQQQQVFKGAVHVISNDIFKLHG